MRGALAAFGLCLVALIEQAFAEVTPRFTQPVNMTVGPHDLLSVYMTEIFHLNKAAVGTYFTVDQGGKIMNITTPWTSMDLSSYEINIIHQIVDMGNGIVGLLYNGRSVLIIPISKDGKYIGEIKSFSDNKLGPEFMCDDMYLNTVQARVYVSCHAVQATAQEPGVSFIYELDFQDGSLLNKIMIDQSDGFFVEVASKMRIVDLVFGSGRQRVLLFYSQALSGSLGLNSNKFVRWMTGVDSGNLTWAPANIIDFKKTNLNFTAFYDIFQYKNSLIISGKLGAGPGQLTVLKSCAIDIYTPEMLCAPITQNTTITLGWAGIVNDSRYVQVDLVIHDSQKNHLISPKSTWSKKKQLRKNSLPRFSTSSLSRMMSLKE